MNSRMLGSGLVFGMVATLLACGGSSGETGASSSGVTSTAGTGGSGGTGGSDGTGGTGGTGGSAPTGCAACYPQCVIDAFATCTPTGLCTNATVGLTDSNTCYANGVKEQSATTGTTGTTTFYKMDGSVCVAGSTTFTTTGGTTTYKDGGGKLLFTDESPLTGGHKVTCDAKTVTIDAASADCQACKAGYFSNSCPTGTCTIP